jgi:hypothetical protein
MRSGSTEADEFGSSRQEQSWHTPCAGVAQSKFEHLLANSKYADVTTDLRICARALGPLQVSATNHLTLGGYMPAQVEHYAGTMV